MLTSAISFMGSSAKDLASRMTKGVVDRMTTAVNRASKWVGDRMSSTSRMSSSNAVEAEDSYARAARDAEQELEDESNVKPTGHKPAGHKPTVLFADMEA